MTCSIEEEKRNRATLVKKLFLIIYGMTTINMTINRSQLHLHFFDSKSVTLSSHMILTNQQSNIPFNMLK